MPRLIGDLETGTPVLAADGRSVGEVRAMYGSGEARTVEFLLVYWTHRAEEALLPADEVASVGENGVILFQNEEAYAHRPAFHPSANPMLHQL